MLNIYGLLKNGAMREVWDMDVGFDGFGAKEKWRCGGVVDKTYVHRFYC